MADKKYLVIDRDLCIGCGSCVIASEGKCDFVEGKAWSEKVEYDDFQEIIDVCPVEAIIAADSEEYDIAKIKAGL